MVEDVLQETVHFPFSDMPVSQGQLFDSNLLIWREIQLRRAQWNSENPFKFHLFSSSKHWNDLGYRIKMSLASACIYIYLFV